MSEKLIPQFKVWCHSTNKFLFNCNLSNVFLVDAFNNVFINHSTPESLDVECLKNVTICRFIGQVDTKSEPIYEGDMFFSDREKTKIRVIEYNNMSYNSQIYACYSAKDYWPVYDRVSTFSLFKDIEIIGSRFSYENSSLATLIHDASYSKSGK